MKVVFGVDIGGTNVKLGVVQYKGEILRSGSIPTRAVQGPESVARRVRTWLAGHLSSGERVDVAGLSCAGLIDAQKGFLYSSPNLPGWNRTALADVFTEALSLPVHVENDVNSAAYGEYRTGSGRGTEHFACVTLGTGVGGGLIIDGRLHRGAMGFAGEIGHMVIQVDGPRCSCGGRGCLEAHVSAQAIVDRVVSLIQSGEKSVIGNLAELTVEEISRAGKGGDVVAIRAFEETGRYLGIGLANLVHLCNPEVIAIGGGVAGAGDLILGPARASLGEHVMDEVLTQVRIVPAVLGNSASLLGAALLAMEQS